MTRYDTKFMKYALEEARAALDEGQMPVGAVAVVGGVVCGRGHRSAAGNPRLDHAEMIALRAALDGAPDVGQQVTIYTTLEPCVMCFGTILHSRIGRVVFALEDPYGGASRLPETRLPERHRVHVPLVERGLLRKQSMELFVEFFRRTEVGIWSKRSNNSLVRLCLRDGSMLH